VGRKTRQLPFGPSPQTSTKQRASSGPRLPPSAEGPTATRLVRTTRSQRGLPAPAATCAASEMALCTSSAALRASRAARLRDMPAWDCFFNRVSEAEKQRVQSHKGAVLYTLVSSTPRRPKMKMRGGLYSSRHCGGEPQSPEERSSTLSSARLCLHEPCPSELTVSRDTQLLPSSSIVAVGGGGDGDPAIPRCGSSALHIGPSSFLWCPRCPCQWDTLCPGANEGDSEGATRLRWNNPTSGIPAE